jgi:hypothetical protein
MSKTSLDTSAEAVERLAAVHDRDAATDRMRNWDARATFSARTAAILRAIVAERDALRLQVVDAEAGENQEIEAAAEAEGARDAALLRASQAEADRDRLAAEVERLRAALRDLMTWFPDKPSPPEWRLPGGEYGADEAVAAARAALGDTP